jgi:hypothetical protein
VWGLRWPMLALILGTELTALILTCISGTTVTLPDVWSAALLASLAVAYSLYSHRSEGARHLLNRRRIVAISDMHAAWTFPAAVLLPMPLVVLVIVIGSVFQWPVRNFDGKALLYRYVYSEAATILAAVVTYRIVHLAGNFTLLLVIAGIAYMLTGLLFVCLAVTLSSSSSNLKHFLKIEGHLNELVTLGVGAAQVVLAVFNVPLLWLSLPAVIGIQRYAMRSESRNASDGLTAPMTERVWGTVAREVVRACTTAAVLRLDTDDPAAARAIAQMQAGCDAIGAVGASGLVILLADCPGPNADSLALRLRSALAGAQVTANVAVAAKPRDGQVLEDLLAVTEAELITREAATRSAKSFRPDA